MHLLISPFCCTAGPNHSMEMETERNPLLGKAAERFNITLLDLKDIIVLLRRNCSTWDPSSSPSLLSTPFSPFTHVSPSFPLPSRKDMSLVSSPFSTSRARLLTAILFTVLILSYLVSSWIILHISSLVMHRKEKLVISLLSRWIQGFVRTASYRSFALG